MTQYSGVLKIVRFNWPWYAAAVGATAVAIFLLLSEMLHGPWLVFIVAGLIAANIWFLLSLAVSHYVYDRSPISQGKWLEGIKKSNVRRAAIFHAGQDEASPIVARWLPHAEIQVFDFYDSQSNGTASLQRARALAKNRDVAIDSDRVPLQSGTLDLGLVVFAAHEIRNDDKRAAFFRELARVLKGDGRVIVVEHLRDGWNFLAYGPGAFHFLSKRTWRRSFAEGGLKLSRESSCTLFVRVFELVKA